MESILLGQPEAGAMMEPEGGDFSSAVPRREGCEGCGSPGETGEREAES